jgi:hypothetical protein
MAGEVEPPEASREPSGVSDFEVVDGLALGLVTLRGMVDQRYRFRKSGEDEDQDIYGYMDLTTEYLARSEAERRVFSRLAFNLQGSTTWDIDSFEGAPPTEGGSFFPFLDVTNTFSDRFKAFLYEANIEADNLYAFEKVRLGRQTVYREESVLFDGAYFRTRRWKTLSLDFYGGLPAHLYESSASGDGFAGAGIESRPLPGLSVGADYQYIHDNRTDIPDVDADASDHLYRFFGRYRFLREWTLGASASWTGSRDRRQTIDLRYLSETFGLMAHFRATRQNGIVDFQSNELSPYYYVMGEYAPYYQLQLDLHQPFLEHYALGAGFNIRQLEDSDDSGEFNHSFNNFFLTFETFELWNGMRALIRGDIWDANGGDETSSLGFELEQSLWIVRARLGTSYSLYRFDEFTGTERERDRVYYARLRWRINEHLSFDTDYRYERDSETEYHVAQGGIRIWF